MSVNTNQTSRRRAERISLSIPVKVEYQESKEVSWNEITRFQSISAFGADFALSQKVAVGQLLLLTATFPPEFRGFDYSVWTLVRRCEPIKASGSSKEHFLIGVGFIGKYPPISHRANPGKRYLLSGFNKDGFCEIAEMRADDELSHPKFSFKIQRREERHSIPFEAIVEILDEKENPIFQESTVTENISHRGSAIKTVLDSEIGSYVRISLVGYDISILAAVRNRRIGEDGVSRLHLENIDGRFPLEGIG